MKVVDHKFGIMKGHMTTVHAMHGREYLVVNGVDFQIFHDKDLASISWGECGADYVCELTGVFTHKESGAAH